MLFACGGRLSYLSCIPYICQQRIRSLNKTVKLLFTAQVYFRPEFSSSTVHSFPQVVTSSVQLSLQTCNLMVHVIPKQRCLQSEKRVPDAFRSLL